MTNLKFIYFKFEANMSASRLLKIEERYIEIVSTTLISRRLKMTSASTTGAVNQRKKRAPMKYRRHTESSKQKVLDAFHKGRDWTTVAIACDIPIKTAERIISSGCVKNKPRGGARKTKFTAEMKDYLTDSLEKNRTLTLREMSAMILRDFDVNVSPQ